ncbi:MAG: right-handed parallel beta-helix repeat-containing protein [Candidatus Heimdallarchaeaceae archaeon]
MFYLQWTNILEYISHNNITLGKVVKTNPWCIYIVNSAHTIIYQNNMTTIGPPPTFPNPNFISVSDSDSITVDSNYFHHYSGMQAMRGIDILYCNNASIRNNIFDGLIAGIQKVFSIRYSEYSTIIHNEIFTLCDFMSLLNVNNITVEYNTVQQEGYHRPHTPIIFQTGTSLNQYLGYRFINNTFNGEEMLYLKNLYNQVLDLDNAIDYSYVFLVNCSKITIKDELYENIRDLNLYYCLDCVVKGCIISYFHLDFTDKTKIDSNSIHHLYLSHSDSNLITKNSNWRDHYNPMNFEESYNNSIIENRIVFDYYQSEGIGVWLNKASGSIITSNYIEFFRNNRPEKLETCIKIDDSDNVIIRNNTFSKGNYSISVANSDNLLILNNTFQNNINYTIYLSSSVTNSSLYNNSFYLSNLNGTSQAYDSGINNVWYNSTELIGNLWSDWNGTGSYSIDGTALSLDLYPIDYQLQLIETPEDYSFLENTSGYNLIWVAMDNNPDFYKIYRNDTEIQTGTWSSGIPISLSIDGLSVGVYNYTILLNDTLGNTIKDTVWVTVTENFPPYLISNTEDFSYVEGTTGHVINWYTETDDSGTYWIYLDDVQIETHELGNGVDIIISVDGLSAGSYNYTIVLEDSVGQIAKDTVWVTVEINLNLPPEITSPGNMTYVTEQELGV